MLRVAHRLGYDLDQGERNEHAGGERGQPVAVALRPFEAIDDEKAAHHRGESGEQGNPERRHAP